MQTILASLLWPDGDVPGQVMTISSFVKVRISGHEFDHVRAEPALEMAERVATDAAYLSLASPSGDRLTFEMLRKLCEQEDAAVGTLRNAPELVRGRLSETAQR